MKQQRITQWRWFWLAGLLWHLGLYQRYRYARYRAYGLTPRQIASLFLRAQLTRAEKLRILWRDKFICHLCQKRGWWQDMEVDHAIPLIKGGDNREWNKRAAHRWCNRHKGAKIIAKQQIENDGTPARFASLWRCLNVRKQ